MTAPAVPSEASHVRDDALAACTRREQGVLVYHVRSGVACVASGRIVLVTREHLMVAMTLAESTTIPLSTVTRIEMRPRKERTDAGG